MVALRDTHGAGDALQGLAGALESLEIGPKLSHLESVRSRLAATIRSYLIPRAFDPSTPLTVVFAGPTGSGKSTLVNSLTRRDLAATGVLRPTTTRPLVLASSHVADGYGIVGGVPCHVVTGDAPVLDSMVLVDTPDIDSVASAHRAAAENLIDNADVVVFVTSALRYADEVPWQVLRRAEARGTEVINVLNRVGSSTSGAIVDFRARLRNAGLDDHLVTVPEHHLPADGSRVPSTAIRSLARRLAGIATERERHIAETFDRVLRSVVLETTGLARDLEELAEETDSLEADLSLYLADRASRVDMGGIADGLYVPHPEKDSRRARRKWRLANRRNHDEVTAGEQAIVDRFTATVQGDLHRWIAEDHQLHMSPGEVIPQLGPVIRSAAEGWVRHVARIGEDRDVPEPWLVQVALIDSASRDQRTETVELLLGDDARVMVDRARRELVRRLEVIYAHAGSHVVEITRHDRGSLDISGLRAALGAVSATLAPADA